MHSVVRLRFQFQRRGCRVESYAVFRISPVGEICFCFLNAAYRAMAGGVPPRIAGRRCLFGSIYSLQSESVCKSIFHTCSAIQNLIDVAAIESMAAAQMPFGLLLHA